MPRPAGTSYFALIILLTLPFTRLTAINTAASQTPPPGGVSHQALGGIWVLNQDRGDFPAAPSGLDGAGRGGRRGGGAGGGRGGQGRGAGAGVNDPQAREDALAYRQALATYLSAATLATKRMTIVITDASVNITDADGRVQNLPTDNKKIDARAGNGLIKLFTRNHWDGNSLICEAEVDLGPRVVRTFALSPGGTELRVTTTVEGQGKPVSLLRFYERPFDSQ
jgi:hypothetical protein